MIYAEKNILYQKCIFSLKFILANYCISNLYGIFINPNVFSNGNDVW